jgi:hypothetical protein
MAKKAADDLSSNEADATGAIARSGPVRCGQRSKASTRSRKKRRKAAASHSGMHLRANKRIAW